MKSILPSIAAILLFANDSIAIPQTFGNGNNGFFTIVGVPFEQYGSDRETWQPGAALKGKWRASAATGAKANETETLELELDAAVFGIPATQVSVERAGGLVQRFVVRFDEGKVAQFGKPAKGGLYSQVTANLTALAGEPKSVSVAGEKTFHYESSKITARQSGAKEVIVEFTPVR